MTEQDRDRVLLAATGELPEAQLAELRARMQREPALRDAYERAARTTALLREARPDGFELGFAARVARRLAREAESRSALAAGLLQRQFLRMVPLATAIALLLGGYTLLGAGRPGQSPLERLLGLQPVNAEAMLEQASAQANW